jgi:hypothetical protein
MLTNLSQNRTFEFSRLFLNNFKLKNIKKHLFISKVEGDFYFTFKINWPQNQNQTFIPPKLKSHMMIGNNQRDIAKNPKPETRVLFENCKSKQRN